MVLRIKISVVFGEVSYTHYVRGWMYRGDLRVEPIGQCARVSFTSSGKVGRDGKNESKQKYSTCAHVSSPGLLLEEQLAGTLRGLHHRLDERDAQLPFFEFEDAVDGAARWSGHCILQQRWMIASL